MRIAPLVLSLTFLFTSLAGCNQTGNLSSEEHLQRAKDNLSQGDIRGSVIELKNSVQKDPNNAQARWLLGQAYLRSKLPDNAIKELETAKKLGVSASALQGDLAEAMLLKRDYAAVLDLVQLDSNAAIPLRAKAMQLRGDALLGLSKPKEACVLYMQASELDPKLSKAQVGLGTCAYIEGKPDVAQKHVLDAIILDEHNPDPKLMLATLARARGDMDAALNAYGNALKNEPANLDALSGRALTLIALNRSKDAEKDIQTLRAYYPKHFMGTYLDAALAARNQEFEKSRDLLQENLKAVPSHLESLFLLGAINIQLNQPGLATQNLNDVLRIAPGSSAARTLLASLYLKRQQPKAAYDMLSPILSGKPNFTQLGLAGDALMQMGRASEANALFKEAAKLEPGSGAPSLALGRVSLQQGNTTEALDFLQQASRIESTRLQAELFMIRTLWQQGKHAEALARLAEARKNDAKNIDLSLLHASLLFQNGDRTAARMAFEQALNIEPNNTRAILALNDLDRKEGKSDQSQDRLSKALKAKPNDEALLLAAALQARQKGQHNEARQYTERAAKANPDAILPQQFLVQAELDSGQFQRALEIARTFSDRKPDSREAKLLLANTQFSAQDFNNAIAGYKRLLADTPSDPTINLQLGLALLSIDRIADAREALKHAVKASNDAFAPLHALANLEARMGNQAIAQELAERLRKNFPKSEAGLSLEGDIAFQQKQFAEALNTYQRALAVNPSSQLMLKIADTHDRLNQPAEAAAKLADWVNRHPADFNARLAYADRLNARGNTTEAIKHYEYLIKIQPQSISGLNNLANLLTGPNPARALKLAQAAHKLAPASPYVMDTYGWQLALNNRAPEGLPILEKAHRAIPTQLSVHYHYAATLAKSGNASQAKRELEKLLLSQQPFPERQEATALLRGL